MDMDERVVPGPEVAKGHIEPGAIEDRTLGEWMIGLQMTDWRYR